MLKFKIFWLNSCKILNYLQIVAFVLEAFFAELELECPEDEEEEAGKVSKI